MKPIAPWYIALLLNLFIVPFFSLQSITAGEVPKYDRTQFEPFPETLAIEKMLLQEKEYGILQTASQVAVNVLEDFGTAVIHYQSGGEQIDLEVFLLKEEGNWIAYSVLPAYKDHPGVFFLLARDYCEEKYGDIEGMGYLDATWKNKDSPQRTINFKCMQQVNKEWKDHDLGLVYEFVHQKGWHIIGESAVVPTQTEKKTPTKHEPVGVKSKKAQQQYPLHLAASLSAISPENEAYAIQLVADGADVNIRNEYGQTALHMLCYSCFSPKLVQAMIDAGADLSIKTNEGHTPLDLINMMLKGGNKGNCVIIQEMLLTAGAR